MNLPDISGYRIVREIGRGGMATVYLAIQEKFDRQVAVKVMDPELLHDETFSARFRRESRIVAKLNHPNIILNYINTIYTIYTSSQLSIKIIIKYVKLM